MKHFAIVFLFLLFYSCHCFKQHYSYISATPYPIYGANCTLNSLVCGSNFVCNNGSCGDCSTDYDCYFYPTFQCKEREILISTNSSQQFITKNIKMCLVKGFWIPTVYDVFTTLICFGASVLAAASGIGGGIMYVPVLLILGRFLFEQAVPISGCIILGTSIPNLFVLLWKRHPHANKSLIDYEVTILVFPILLMGVTLGVMLNIVLPSWLQAALLILFMLISVYRTSKRGLLIYRRERKIGELLSKLFQNKTQISTIASPTAEAPKTDSTEQVIESNASEQQQQPSPTQNITTTTPRPTNEEIETTTTTTTTIGLIEPKHDTDLEENYTDLTLVQFKPILSHIKSIIDVPLVKEKISNFCFYLISQYPIIIWILLGFCWFLVLFHALVKGGMSFNSIFQIEKCSLSYWIVTASIYPILFLIWICIAIALRVIYYIRLKKGYKFIAGDVRFTTTNTFILPLAFLASGVSGSLLGVGTGILSSPLLEEFGLLSQVSMATSAFLIFFTSSTTVTLFIINGNLKWDYFLWFLTIGALSTLCGRYIVGAIVKRLKVVSWIIFVIVFTIIIMVIAVIISGIYHLLFEIATDTYITFKNPCGRVFE